MIGKREMQKITINKPIKRISKLVLPKSPYGETTHYLCEDCIKKIYGGIKDE